MRVGWRIGTAGWLLSVSALLVACGTAPKAPQQSGGYYQNDGPPAQVPVDLARAPEVVPRVEPLHPSANRPYVALGRSYTPLTADVAFRQRGRASWYGRQFHGNRTSSGEIYDMFAMTAAHPTLPIPSYVRVTSVRDRATVIVRVNDRGPFKDDRIIDLSYAAATKLGFAGAGTAEVEIERLTHALIASGRCCERTVAAAEATAQVAAQVAAQVEPIATAVPVVPSDATSIAVLPAVDPGVSAAPARWSVQLGAFAHADKAHALRERIAAILARSTQTLSSADRQPRIERDGLLHRVLIGALAERGAALLLARQIEQALQRDTTLYQSRSE